MSRLRTVGEPLRLRASLTDGATDKFVRAFLFNSNGSPHSPATVDLVHANEGIYADDDTVLMPNQAQILVKYKVFDDSAFTELNDCDYDQHSHCFELSKFDPVSIRPTNQVVRAGVSQARVQTQIQPRHDIKVAMLKNKIKTQISAGGIVSTVRNKQQITGVVSDE